MNSRTHNLMLAVSVFFISAATADIAQAAKLYWSNGSPEDMRRADLDGSNVEVFPGTTGPNWGGVAVDTGASHVYFTEWQGPSTSEIRRTDLDGTNSTTLIGPGTSDVLGAMGIALDVAGGKMYYGTNDRHATTTNALRRANLDGTSPELLFSFGGGESGRPWGIDVDPTSGKIYAAREGEVTVANMDGSGTPTAIAIPGEKVYDVKLDASKTFMYLAIQDGNFGGGDGRIEHRNIDGTSPLDVTPASLSSDDFFSVAVDSTNEFLFFLDFQQNKIFRSDLLGGNLLDLGITHGNVLPRGFLATDVVQAAAASGTPEPGTFGLAALGLAGLGLVALRRRRKKIGDR